MKRLFLFSCLFLALLNPQGIMAATPVNAESSNEARALLNYLHAMKGKKTLSGQMDSPWGIDEFATVYKITGKYPAIRGMDLITERDNNGEIQKAIDWWKQGGIPTVMWHWGAPSIGEGYDNSKKKIDIARCFQQGTAEYTAMWADLKRIADHLTKLRDAKVPILWRPMHECDGGWFWYGMGSAAQFNQLWQTMYNYFTKDRGLNNLIWVLCHSGEVKTGWDPGKQYYDLAGADSYGTGIQKAMYDKVVSIHGNTSPIPYHECGTIPDPSQSINGGAPWSWWMLWHTDHLSNHNADALKAAYLHDLVITLDEIPKIMDFLDSSDVQCTPITIAFYAKIGATENWVEMEKATVTAGDSIALGPHPWEGGTWTWSGPNNFIAASREIAFKKLTVSQAGYYKATYTDTFGCKSSDEFQLTIQGGTTQILHPYREKSNQGTSTSIPEFNLLGQRK